MRGQINKIDRLTAALVNKHVLMAIILNRIIINRITSTPVFGAERFYRMVVVLASQ